MNKIKKVGSKAVKDVVTQMTERNDFIDSKSKGENMKIYPLISVKDVDESSDSIKLNGRYSQKRYAEPTISKP